MQGGHEAHVPERRQLAATGFMPLSASAAVTLLVSTETHFCGDRGCGGELVHIDICAPFVLTLQYDMSLSDLTLELSDKAALVTEIVARTEAPAEAAAEAALAAAIACGTQRLRLRTVASMIIVRPILMRFLLLLNHAEQALRGPADRTGAPLA